jgi:hypothetical protein
MTAPLTPSDRTRLTKLLGMLGSSHPGERDNAAVAAHRLIQTKGLTWSDIILGPAHSTQPAATSDVIVPWREQVAACLAQPGSLRKWEVNFQNSLRTFSKISSKQRNVLTQITDRVLRRAA